MLLKYKHRELKFTKEFIESLPKTVDSNTGCWLYTGYLLRGYGVICIDYKDYPIHRLSASVYLGFNYFDYKIEACHKVGCKNKSCFNPNHLYAGTHSQNMNDKTITKTHHQLKKEVCPRCGSRYILFTSKSGARKGKTQRYCRNCQNKRRRK